MHRRFLYPWGPFSHFRVPLTFPGGQTIEPPFPFFEKQVEVTKGNPVVFPSLAIGLVPKVANPIDMSLALDQTVSVGDPEMPEGGDIPSMVVGQVPV